MQDFLKRISSYNLFNYLFPGVLFAVIAEKISQWSFIYENTIITLFLCYFYGIVISRIGSLVIEPIIEKLGNIKKKRYSEYIKASKEDNLIPILSEVRNTYRTIISLIVSVLCLYGISEWHKQNPCVYLLIYIAVPIGLFALFIFSYKKQSNYILERIDTILSREKDEK